MHFRSCSLTCAAVAVSHVPNVASVDDGNVHRCVVYHSLALDVRRAHTARASRTYPALYDARCSARQKFHHDRR